MTLETKQTILDELGANRIFEVELSEDKRSISITEACDDCFQQKLDKKKFSQLIQELIQIYGEME